MFHWRFFDGDWWVIGDTSPSGPSSPLNRGMRRAVIAKGRFALKGA